MRTQIRIAFILTAFMAGVSFAEAQPADTVVLRVGKESKVIFSIKDKQDLETLKQYNFQALMDDMLKKLENRDSTALQTSPNAYLKDTTSNLTPVVKSDDTWLRDREREREDYGYRRIRTRRSSRSTYHSFNVDLGMNNYLENGKFPDGDNTLYTVKPWGSWYVGLNSVLRTRITGKFFVEWGAGVTWYNFKFNDRSVVMSKDSIGVNFSQDSRPFTFTKSKLTVAYINFSVVPMIDFGGGSRKAMIFDGDRFGRGGSFRIGVGPYVGYRLDSYTKQVWEENGDTQKSHTHDNYYLNNMRYGVRAQLGFRGMDIFFNYDLNDLFITGKAPTLHAFSFGITL